MKNVMIVFVLVLLIQYGYGQKNIDNEKTLYQYKNVLKLSPVELGRAEFQVGYERYFKQRSQSLCIMPSIIKSQRENETRDGYQLMLQYRFYLSQLQRGTSETLNMYNIGFYTAPYLVGLTYNEVYETGIYDPVTYENKYELIEESVQSVEGGALMGIQLDITKRIVFDFFVGGGIRESQVTVNKPDDYVSSYGVLDVGYSGVKPRIGLQMGITF